MLNGVVPHPSFLESFRPTFQRLRTNLISASFPLMKIFPAVKCIQDAVTLKIIDKQSLIIESSSGTMALALAIACRWAGHKLTIVTDSSCDEQTRLRLCDLDVALRVVDTPSAIGGLQRARLDVVDNLLKSDRQSWWVNQYDNTSNSNAYASVACNVIEQVGMIDALVGPVGSGGSMCGLAKFLRLLNPDLQVIGVDTPGSVLFGAPDATRTLRGLGNSIVPLNLDHTAFDEVHWVPATHAFSATRRLYKQAALFRGPTSGASWMVAEHYATRNPDFRVLCLFPDDGHRYTTTVYSDTYLADRGLWSSTVPAAPETISHPSEMRDTWCSFPWRRRNYTDVIGFDVPDSLRAAPIERSGSALSKGIMPLVEEGGR